jgi:hypothetical protein
MWIGIWITFGIFFHILILYPGSYNVTESKIRHTLSPSVVKSFPLAFMPWDRISNCHGFDGLNFCCRPDKSGPANQLSDQLYQRGLRKHPGQSQRLLPGLYAGASEQLHSCLRFCHR